MTVQNYISGRTAVNIQTSVETAVAAGRLRGGDLLPAVRTLAAQLDVSPATVAAAYRLLRDRGLAIADGRRGTSIRHAAPLLPPPAAPLPPHVRDLSDGNPDGALLPDLATAVRASAPEQRLYGDETINDERLLALARKQFAADGVAAEQIAVVSGALDGIERVLREHLRAGDRVIVEDPCFTGVADLLSAVSLVAVPVAVDDQGLIPAELRKALRSPAAALIVTPRAQNPTGAAFTPKRARELRALLASRPELLLIEDDHAGPIAGAPYVTLRDASRARWAVVRSVSKSLGPDLRVALVACDAQTMARVEGRQTLGIRWVSHILQRIVAAMWSNGHTQTRLARAERIYGERRDTLLRELAKHGINAHGASGLNVWIPVPEESAVVQGLLHAGWAVQAGERYRIRSAPAIRVTIAALERADAVAFADDLARILRPRSSGRAGGF
jgi:DNA-binding transcriptional MocR family regulator